MTIFACFHAGSMRVYTLENSAPSLSFESFMIDKDIDLGSTVYLLRGHYFSAVQNENILYCKSSVFLLRCFCCVPLQAYPDSTKEKRRQQLAQGVMFLCSSPLAFFSHSSPNFVPRISVVPFSIWVSETNSLTSHSRTTPFSHVTPPL